MISFVKKKTDTRPLRAGDEGNRFEQVRKAAADKRGKSNSDATRGRGDQKAEDDRLL